MQKFYTHKIKINKEQNLKRLDQALTKLLDNVTRSQIKNLLQNHNVRKKNNIVTEASLKVKEGEEYFIAIPNVEQTNYKPEKITLNLSDKEEIIDIEIIDENRLLITINSSDNLKGMIYNIKRNKIIKIIEK